MSWIAGLPERIADKIVPEPNSGCWLWTGTFAGKEYGQTFWNGKSAYAHRTVYEILKGPIPEGLCIDHLCRVPSCVNPDRLEPVTMKENLRRGEHPGNGNKEKTHCPKGHLYSGENLYVRRKGWRQCRTCRTQQGILYRLTAKSKTWRQAYNQREDVKAAGRTRMRRLHQKRKTENG